MGRVDEVDLNVDSTVDQRFTFTYDQKGNVVLQVQDSDVGANGSIDRRVETTFGYDQKGNLVQQVQETDNGNDGTVDSRSDFTFVPDKRATAWHERDNLTPTLMAS